MMRPKNKAAVALGRLGGRVKSDAKANAARANAKRPKPHRVTGIAYSVLLDGGKQPVLGIVLVRGSFALTQEAMQEYLRAAIAADHKKEVRSMLDFEVVTRSVRDMDKV